MIYGTILTAIIFAAVVFSGCDSSRKVTAKNPEYSATQKLPDLYHSYWQPGTLDPARNAKWPELPEGKVILEHIPVEPEYIRISYQNDLWDTGSYEPSSYENYIPRGGGNELQIIPHGEKTIVLMIDLGRTMPGTIAFEANPPPNTLIKISTGEAMEPTRAYNPDEKPDGTWKTFRPYIKHAGYGSMRFVWIYFKGVSAGFSIKNLHGIYQVYPANYIGDFQSSDKILNRIWEMCAYSAHCVMGQPTGDSSQPRAVLQTLCLDRVDRQPWAGDSRVIQSVVSYIFGDYSLLRHAHENLLRTGTRPIPDLQGIPPYTLDWGLSLIAYFKVSGDTAYLEKRFNDLTAVIEKYNGPIPKGWMFFDWDHRIDSRSKDPRIISQQNAAFTGKYVQLCHQAAWVAEIINKNTKANEFNEIAKEKTLAWRKKHASSYKNYEVHAMTNLILGGVLSKKDYKYAYDHIYSDRLKRCTGTPYFGIYVLDALAKIDHYEAAIQMLHDYWGTMIEAGATTTWEEWMPTLKLPVNAQPPQYGPSETWGGLSLIQPAGAGPARWLLSEIVGIKPAKPGFRRVLICPHLAGLRWVRGAVATPEGPVKVSCSDTNAGFELSIDIPGGIEGADCLLPRGRKYFVDGKVVKPSKGSGGVAIFDIGNGEHVFKVLN